MASLGNALLGGMLGHSDAEKMFRYPDRQKKDRRQIEDRQMKDRKQIEEIKKIDRRWIED